MDASPDLKPQLDMVVREMGSKQGVPVKGILLTHAHMGHVLGLWQLGKEAMDTKEIPVFCTPKMNKFISENYPFSLLVQRKNIVINEIQDNVEFEIGNFKCKSILVPHRNEIADTVGFIVQSQKRMIYIPDIDHWTQEIIDEIKKTALALIDGTFYSKDEIPRFEEVPHPPMLETMELLKGVETEIYFTHINHTNAINFNGKERVNIENQGFKVVYDGMIFEI
jgi:pyrroloquinoline quinone biosynthesis protein B